MSHRTFFFALLLAAQSVVAQTILVAPYLQPGNGSSLTGTDEKVLAWVTDQVPGDFTVEYATGGAALKQATAQRVQLDFGPSKVKTSATPTPKPGANLLSDAATDLDALKQQVVRDSAVRTPEKEQHYFTYHATLEGLPFDSVVTYRVRLGAKVVREGTFKTRASAGKPIRFVAVGDLANGKPPQNGIAWQIAQQLPDFMIALGDIVYPRGRVSEYMHHFWTTYNDVPQPGPKTGAPLFASIPLYPVVGNHDVESGKLPEYPDAFGAYYFFHVPRNGPGLGAWNLPLGKDKVVAAAFREKAGATYPALNVYSWDAGAAHFVALDSSGHVNPADPKLRAWLEADLRGSRQPWKIVCFHAPAFHTSREHYTEQKMRLWEPLLEQCGVDVVFAGHVHNYQRSKPLRFTQVGKRDARGRINGDLRVDEKLDGVKHTTPDGIIHIVSGGGGASLYSADFAKTVEALEKEHGANYVPLTAKYVGQHSFSLIDLTATNFTLRQIAITGEEVDRFTITKAQR